MSFGGLVLVSGRNSPVTSKHFKTGSQQILSDGFSVRTGSPSCSLPDFAISSIVSCYRPDSPYFVPFRQTFLDREDDRSVCKLNLDTRIRQWNQISISPGRSRSFPSYSVTRLLRSTLSTLTFQRPESLVFDNRTRV